MRGINLAPEVVSSGYRHSPAALTLLEKMRRTNGMPMIKDFHRTGNNLAGYLCLGLATILLAVSRASPDLLNTFTALGTYIDWKYTHFLFNYQEGFVKRGLIGELVAQINGLDARDVAQTVSYASLLIMVVMLYHLFARPWRERSESQGAFLWVLLAISSSATVQHFALDIGRFDAILYIVLLAQILILSTRADLHAFYIFLIVTITNALSILIHEAAFFITIPFIYGYWHYLNPSRRETLWQCASFLVIFFITCLISIYGNYKAGSLEEHFFSLLDTHGSWVSEASVSVLHKTTLLENIQRTMEHGLSVSRAFHHMTLLLVNLPLFYIIFRLVKKYSGPKTQSFYCLILLSLGPLALYPLGHDHFRWWALAITNSFMALTLGFIHSRPFAREAFRLIEEHRRLVVLILFLSVLLGPLGITESYSLSIFMVAAWL